MDYRILGLKRCNVLAGHVMEPALLPLKVHGIVRVKRFLVNIRVYALRGVRVESRWGRGMLLTSGRRIVHSIAMGLLMLGQVL